MLDLFLPKKAPSHRQQRVAEELRQVVSSIILSEDLPIVTDSKNESIKPSAPISVTFVNISPDLKYATVGVMPLGGTDQDLVETYLKLNCWFIKKKLASKIKLRCIPELRFKLDVYFERSERIDSILHKNHSKENI